MKAADFRWTPEADAFLRGMIADGADTREMSERISKWSGQCITRKAVIGRRFRLGLSNPATVAKRTDLFPHRLSKRNGSAVLAGIKNVIKESNRNRRYGGLAVKIVARHGDIPPPPPDGELRDLRPETKVRPVVALLDLEPHHCRWPIGNPRSADFGFCGANRESPLTPYCCEHHRRAARGRVRAVDLVG